MATTEVMHKIRNYPFKLFPRNGFLPGEGMKYDGEENRRIVVIEREDELEFGNI